MAIILGIDFGTTSIRMAAIKKKAPEIITNAEGMPSTLSMVGFSESGKPLVGDVAKQQAVSNPQKTIYSIKRFLGRRYDEVQQDINHFGYKVVCAANGDAAIEVEVDGKPKLFSPLEISAMILGKIKADASMRLGKNITAAVITVPACFNDSQRRAIMDAGRIAGLEVKRIINETTAAALAYGVENMKSRNVAVLNFGGGVFEISMLNIGDNVFEVLSTNGDTQLGGDDINNILTSYLADEFKRNEGIDLTANPMAYQYLKEAAEKAKCDLSIQLETSINLPFIAADASGPKHLQIVLTRSKFEDLCEHVFEQLRNMCRKALEDAKLKPSEVDEVLFVGGSSRIPKVHQIVKDIFNKEPNKSFKADEIVASGAAILGDILTGKGFFKDILILDVVPLSLGIETTVGVMTKIIQRNTTIPAVVTEMFSTATANQTSVDIHVLQGERELAKDNRTISNFQVTGIPRTHRGVPQIEVTFEIDVNGILHISSKDVTGKQRVIIETSGLSDNFHRVEEQLMHDFNFAEMTVANDGNNLLSWTPTLNPDEIKAAVQAAQTILARRAEALPQPTEEWPKPIEPRVLKEQYELLAEVGRGGFGGVYRARDIHLDQFVAIKELMLENPTSLKEEAKALSELRHTNVVGFRQLFPDDGRWYMVMDFVDGGSLARLIHRRILYEGAKEQVLQGMLSIAAQTAAGLNCAHVHGVVHQDVKPANVMVSPGGIAKVSDFGLAKARPQTIGALEQGRQQNIMVSMNGMTQAYCSPEQAAGQMLTKMTDVWSWGLLMMEMFIGEVTWMHGTAAPQVLRGYKENGTRGEGLPEMPQNLTVLLERCFEREPNARPSMWDIMKILTEPQGKAKSNWLSRLFK